MGLQEVFPKHFDFSSSQDYISNTTYGSIGYRKLHFLSGAFKWARLPILPKENFGRKNSRLLGQLRSL